MNKLKFITLFFIFLLLFPGCGDGGVFVPTPTPTIAPTSTPAPTVTPVPPTATPTLFPPLLTSIRDSWESGKGDDKDPDNNQVTMNFTLTGTNFGTLANSVTFNYTSGGIGSVPAVSTATINKWSDKEIQGCIKVDAGVYIIKVKVGTQTTGNNIYYYKGSGNSSITIE